MMSTELRRLRAVLVVVVVLVLLASNGCEAKRRTIAKRGDGAAVHHQRQIRVQSPLTPPPSPPPKGDSSLFELIPGRYPEAISLPDVLRGLSNTTQGNMVTMFLINYIETHLGITIPKTEIPSLLNDTSLLLNYFALTVYQLHEAAESLNLAYQLNLLPRSNSTSFTLPELDLLTTNFSSFGINVNNFYSSLEPLVINGTETPFLLGYLKNETTPEERALQSIVLSTVLNQLSNNLNQTEEGDSIYTVMADGFNFTDVESLFEYLTKETNHTLSNYNHCRVANFLSLWYNSSEGLFEVPFPVMTKTGIYNSTTGEEAIVPAIHCTFVIGIEGPVLNTQISWYEGVDGIGFFPWNIESENRWLGAYESPQTPTDQLIPLLNYASHYQTVLILAAKMFDLFLSGYGATGVCLDSLSVILNSLNSTVIDFYPLMIEKTLVIPALENLAERSSSATQDYLDLMNAVDRMPSDYYPQSTQNQATRLMNMFPWAPGSEPFQCVVDARYILDNCVSGGNNCN
eukprot:TRINITY_DN11700_c0_g1_i1.p1 TRINITY_DN11700_c0_g1~~TRINITY_DN11700_c0_g1_i1.p1  ORF type:complete len:515 (+),score=147.54 TRINITY_DN11700_c0_g1_i1:69-1613(+)